jgi:hypothetical protein
MGLLQWLFEKTFGKLFNRMSYGILKPCWRCSYQKRYEPILIFSKDRGPRILMIPDNGVYVRDGECISFEKCGKCFHQININSELPCKWKKL